MAPTRASAVSIEKTSLSTVRALLQSARIRFTVAVYERGEALFRQGDSSDCVFHIEKGRVELVVTSRNGKEVICGLLTAGSFVGEEALSGHTIRHESAIAMDPTEVLVVSKARMTEALRTQPAMRNRVVASVVARGVGLQSNLADQLLNGSEQRLARALFVLAGCDARRPCPRELPRISKETIAEMVGTTRSRVSIFMAKFKKLGFVDDEGGVLRVKPSLLHVVDEGLTPFTTTRADRVR